MDETTLTDTLRSLAADAPLHSAPSADARRRAARLRRNRRTGAVGLATVLTLAVLGTLQGQTAGRHGDSAAGTSPRGVRELTDPNNPNRATTGYLGLSRAGGGQYLVYWQGRHLCFQTSAPQGSSTDSECASVTPSSTASMTVANIGSDALFVSVAPGVAYVDVRHPDGTGEALSPNSADGFPYAVVVAQGKVMSLRARDKAGRQVGDPVPGPDALQLRPVLAAFACSRLGGTGFDLRLADPEHPKSCYGLGPVGMNFVPGSARAVPDSTNGWVVQVSLTASDRLAFGQLTQKVASQSPPKNQLAIVLDGKLLSAPVIQQGLPGGVFVVTGGTKAFDERQAGYLAAQMSG